VEKGSGERKELKEKKGLSVIFLIPLLSVF